MGYPHGTLLDFFLILCLTLEIKTLKNDCDCFGVTELGIMCKGLSLKSSLEPSFKICKPELFFPDSTFKLIIRDSESLQSLDLSKDFGEGLPSQFISEIQIVNNSHLRRIVLCDPQISSCGDVFPVLETLDLRNNFVSDSISPTTLFDIPTLKQIYLSGNPWSCFSKDNNQSSHKLSWLLSSFKRSLIQDDPTCSKPKSNAWHQNHARSGSHSSNVTLHYFLEFNETLRKRCPQNCICLTININRPLLVKVSCVGLNLTKLPDVLPPNTSDLDVSYNKLKSIGELRTNRDYHNLSKLRAVKNKITSLSDLRGSPFMRNRPTTINFQNNSITHFDVDLMGPLLSEMRNKNFHGSVDFLFFGNPLDCNCKNLTKLQQFLYKYKLYFRDADLLACGVDQSPILIQIDYTQFCETSIDYMWIVIVGELILLILVLSRLTYDVINYRRSGELPWLAKHMYLGCTYAGLRKSTLPTLFRNTECQSNCNRANSSLHEDARRLDDENDENHRHSHEDNSSKTSRTFILREAFRPKRLTVITGSSSSRSDQQEDFELGDSCI
ncbi:protein singed wings 2 isoform X2 [Lepeophtheirus salmonis]|uniref:protein singed wings 2 isoform X2 n=1 Tax=Lepeophtheirus salmonis TaxID=72036 RepID=UPI001AE9C71C|nr:protein singed wings 2-like isoform X2 [Lepeophtheirus salmonis]